MAENEEKALLMLKYSYEMYEKTKKQTEKNMRKVVNPDGSKAYDEKAIEEELSMIEFVQKEVYDKYVALGGNPENLTRSYSRTRPRKEIGNIKPNVEEEPKKEIKPEKSDLTIEKDYSPAKFEYNPQAAYDVIPIPSKGECYKNKLGKIPVAYLTAYDENMIIAPNLYRENKIIDMMLKEKVVDTRIDTYDMLEGDREAIILFLRASGYGNEYPITAKDSETGIEFDTVFDLSKLQFKPFKLKGDENGWFDFTLPVSKKEIKFRFLTHKDNVLLKQIEDEEDKANIKAKIQEYVEDLERYIEDDEDVEKNEKAKIRQAISTIDSWQENMEETETSEFSHSLTNRLELSIMAVDGVTDRGIVRDFIRKMNVRDSSALRKYITDNEPGIDYNIEVERPESLGGGSMKVFLQLDQYLFLNIA